MRAIFIDAVNRKVEEVQIENELQAFYDKIGCESIEVLEIGKSHLLVCDEEGKLRDWKVGFCFPNSEGIAGNGLVICSNEDGDFCDATAPLELFQICTHFLDLTKTPLPPPAFGFAPLPDLKPETIAKAREIAQRDLEDHRWSSMDAGLCKS